MKKLTAFFFAALLALAGAAPTPSAHVFQGETAANANTKKRGPVFRATKDQIKQAQTLLKQKGHYSGDVTGKLDADTRAGLKKFQEAEGIKVTGTLNRATLEKMSITLTEKQRAM